MDSEFKVGGTKNSEEFNNERLQVSSKGKRLFSFLLDFIFALLLANTITQISRKEHWDLALKSRDFQELLPFYGSIIFILLIKDIFGCSIGKFLLGMSIRLIHNFSSCPSIFVLLGRNIFLLIFPLESVILLKDDYARRLADKFFSTVVLDTKKTLRPILRIFLGNIILFGFFSTAIFFQQNSIEKTAVFQKAEKVIRAQASLKMLLEKFPEIEEPEMHLDLRGKKQNPSVVRVRIGREDFGKFVTVSLFLRKDPISWEVLDIEVTSVNQEGLD